MIRKFKGQKDVYFLELQNEGHGMNFEISVSSVVADERAKDMAQGIQKLLPEASISVEVKDENYDSIYLIYPDGRKVEIK